MPGSTALWRAARVLGRQRRRGQSRNGKSLPVAWFVVDPDRTPDPSAIAQRLPRGAGVIFRHFGRPQALDQALKLARIARRRGLVLLIGADEALAAKAKADGVHLPERMSGGVRRLKARRPHWIVTVAAHSPAALRRASGADAAVLSTVFESRSPSAGRPIGVVRLSALAHASDTPVIALGGVTSSTARRLGGSSVAGFAAVDAFA
jgi:thiamine-phosphate pyrophosphorylase